MNYYEIVYIVHPALQAGHLDDIVSQVHKKIEQLNGKVLYQDHWGKKKLSYLIQKQKYGTYILLQCMIDGVSINEISTDFELNTNILRHLVTKIDESQIFEQKESNDKKEGATKNQDKNSVKENVEADKQEDSNAQPDKDSDTETIKEEKEINETGE